jgi:isopenicillin N synthase-like dioxygenase
VSATDEPFPDARMSRLPIVDIGAFAAGAPHRSRVVEAVDRALSDCGFMYAVGHGIDARTLGRAFDAAHWFFGQTRKFKDRYAYRDLEANFGFQGIERERLDPTGLPDLKESFTMRNALERADETSRWPAGDFRDVALALYTVGLRAAYRLMEVLASCLALPADFFALRHRGENITLRFLHYPAGSPARTAAQLGAGAHTDYGAVTLLFQDEVGGLELLGADGRWQGAPPMAGAAVINTGDLMERWTNGRFRSTVHRVRPIAGNRDRYSIALFVDPDSGVEVDCLDSCVSAQRPKAYPPITAGEHLRRKLAATHPNPAAAHETR